jgi:hypothetical protein
LYYQLCLEITFTRWIREWKFIWNSYCSFMPYLLVGCVHNT